MRRHPHSTHGLLAVLGHPAHIFRTHQRTRAQFTHARARTHARTHARAHAHARTHACTRACTQAVFVFYAVYSKNQVYCNKKIIFPTFISGMMWALVQVAAPLRRRTSVPLGSTLPRL